MSVGNDESKYRAVTVPVEFHVVENRLWMPGFWSEAITAESKEMAAVVGHTFGMGGGSVFLRYDRPERDMENGRYVQLRGRSLIDGFLAATAARDKEREVGGD